MPDRGHPATFAPAAVSGVPRLLVGWRGPPARSRRQHVPPGLPFFHRGVRVSARSSGGGSGAAGRSVALGRHRALPHHLSRAPRGAGSARGRTGRAGLPRVDRAIPRGSVRAGRHRSDRPRRRLQRLRPALPVEPGRPLRAASRRPPRAGLLRRLARAAGHPRAGARLPPRLRRDAGQDLPHAVRARADAAHVSRRRRPRLGSRGTRDLVRVGADRRGQGARDVPRDGAPDGGAGGAVREHRTGKRRLAAVAGRHPPLRLRVALLRLPARQARPGRHGCVRRGGRAPGGTDSAAAVERGRPSRVRRVAVERMGRLDGGDARAGEPPRRGARRVRPDQRARGVDPQPPATGCTRWRRRTAAP